MMGGISSYWHGKQKWGIGFEFQQKLLMFISCSYERHGSPSPCPIIKYLYKYLVTGMSQHDRKELVSEYLVKQLSHKLSHWSVGAVKSWNNFTLQLDGFICLYFEKTKWWIDILCLFCFFSFFFRMYS